MSYQCDLEQQELMAFAQEVFLIHARQSPSKNTVSISSFADYLISLGMCPNIEFLYKVRLGMMVDYWKGTKEA